MDRDKLMLNKSTCGAAIAKQTDLPVLLPLAAQSRQAALIERREGTYRLNIQPRHALCHAGASGRFDQLKEVALSYAFALKIAGRA